MIYKCVLSILQRGGKGIVKSRTQAGTTIDNVCDICVCVCVCMYMYKKDRTTHKLPATVLEAEAGFIVGCLQDNKTTIYDILKSSRHFSIPPPAPPPVGISRDEKSILKGTKRNLI